MEELDIGATNVATATEQNILNINGNNEKTTEG
jgi:hypothetical protein